MNKTVLSIAVFISSTLCISATSAKSSKAQVVIEQTEQKKMDQAKVERGKSQRMHTGFTLRDQEMAMSKASAKRLSAAQRAIQGI